MLRAVVASQGAWGGSVQVPGKPNPTNDMPPSLHGEAQAREALLGQELDAPAGRHPVRSCTDVRRRSAYPDPAGAPFLSIGAIRQARTALRRPLYEPAASLRQRSRGPASERIC